MDNLKHYKSNEKNDKKIQDNIRNLLIRSASMIVNNSILKKYIDEETVKETILFHTQTIKESYKLENGFLIDPQNVSIIYLPSYYFSDAILYAMEQNSTINSYDELIKEIERTSLMLITRCFNEKKLPLIAYFISQSKQKEIRDINIYDTTFKTYGTVEPLLENIVKIISYIIGDDLIAETLQQNDECIIWNAITKKTKNNLLTLELINTIKNFKEIIQKLNEIEEKVLFSKNLYNDKITPLKNATENIKDKTNKNRTIRQIEKCDFDMEDYFLHHMNFFDLPKTNFTKKEIEHIEKLRSIFNIKFLNDDNNLASNIEKNLPKKKQDCNWIDKIEVVMKLDDDEFKQLRKMFIKCYTELTDKLIEVISITIKNKNLTISPNEMENMLSLMTFNESYKNNKLQTRIQIKFLQKRNKKV